MKLYKIRNWDELYENNRSRQIKDLSWVAMPNRLDGETFSSIMQHQDGAMIFSAFVLMVEIASRCHPRGTLIRGNGQPHNVTSLTLKCRCPDVWFKTAIPYLESNTDWLECVELGSERQEGDTQVPDERHPCATERKEGKDRKEGGKGLKTSPLIREIHEAWNSLGPVPQCLIVSDKRRRILETRIRDDFFASNWQPALQKIKSSRFCCGENNRGWRATFDWFLQPDVVAKVMEGKYDSAPTNGHYKPKRTGEPNL